jgi:hypothetical protein
LLADWSLAGVGALNLLVSRETLPFEGFADLGTALGGLLLMPTSLVTVHDVQVKPPVIHMEDILRQVSTVLPNFDFGEVQKRFTEFTHEVVKAEQNLEKALAEGNFDIGQFGEAFTKEIEKRGLEFHQELLETSTLTKEDEVHFADLERSLDKALEKVAHIFVDVAVALNVDGHHAQGIFNVIKDPLRHMILIAGISPHSSFLKV